MASAAGEGVHAAWDSGASLGEKGFQYSKDRARHAVCTQSMK